MAFCVVRSEHEPLTRWQQQTVDALRTGGARDTGYYTVPVADATTPSRYMRRVARRVDALHPASAGGIAWRPWCQFEGAQVDFTLCFADAAACLTLESGARHGDWFFRPGLAPAVGVLEQVLSGQPVITVGLYRHLSGEGPVLLHEGAFQNDPSSFVRTLDLVLTGVSDWPLRMARAVAAKRALTFPSAASRTAQPGNVTRRPARVRARIEALIRRDVWNVGVAAWPSDGSGEGAVTLRPTWLPDPPHGHYLADPFPVRAAGPHGITILAEDYSYRDRTGRLVTLEWNSPGDPPTEQKPAFEMPHHASYPFVVHTAEGTFCVPECLRAAEVAAWRLDDDGSWTKAVTLVSGRRLVDPTVARHDGRWWLFATDEDHGSNTSLYGWHADKFSGPWLPHPLNPLKNDVRSSRPAGPLFRMGERTIRPAQDCSRTYGGQIVLNEIVRLNNVAFEERTLGTVRIAEDSPYPQGPHTLTFLAPDRVLIDGKRTESVDLGLAVRRLPRRALSGSRRVLNR